MPFRDKMRSRRRTHVHEMLRRPGYIVKKKKKEINILGILQPQRICQTRRRLKSIISIEMNYGGSLLYKFGKFLPVKDRPFITFELSVMTGTVSPQ